MEFASFYQRFPHIAAQETRVILCRGQNSVDAVWDGILTFTRET
jgi:hypothetical protein